MSNALLIRRRGMMAGEALPYDAEIEYLESTGTQYIDTGIKPSVAKETEITLTISRTESAGAYEGFGANGNLNCVKASGTPTKWRLNGVSLNKNITNNEIVTITLKQTSSGRYYELENYSGYGSNSQTANNFLFGELGGAPNYKYNGRLYSLNIKEEDELIINMFPVRCGTTGYMYDTVSGTLFGNAGTGDFIVGPDKS